MSTFSKDIEDSVQETIDDTDYTYVEGVGNIPRDIYKHVKSDPLGDLPRYSIHIVIQHLITFITFLVLASTGLPLYYSDTFWAPYLINIFGGSDTARLVHNAAAFLMIAGGIYHLLTIIGGSLQKAVTKQFDYRRTQIPHLQDIKDLIHDIKYFLGTERYRPKMQKFMYKQKMHYLALLWGNFVLISAGTMLLYPEAMSQLLPNPLFFQNLARLLHADEAIMALLIIVFWHWFNVHLAPGRFPFQWTALTGRITREHQIEEHFLEYLHNLRDIPEEREYMRNLLEEKSSEIKGGDL